MSCQGFSIEYVGFFARLSGIGMLLFVAVVRVPVAGSKVMPVPLVWFKQTNKQTKT